MTLPRNQIDKYTKRLFHNEIDKFNSALQIEIFETLNNGCIYLPNYYCKKNDKTIFKALMDEISKINDPDFLMNWSKHHKIENPNCLPTFNIIIENMANAFNIQIMQTRLNYYVDNNDWKPFHHDKHAYINDAGENLQENYTLGVTFGYSRDLVFLHEPTGKKIRFPQDNGDVFGFDSAVNKMFMHGVPKSTTRVGPRISIIIWGIKK